MGEVLERQAQRELLTVEKFCEKQKAFKVGGIRWQIFHRSTNGLEASGAIVRVGRRVLIDRAKYFAWIDSQQKVGA
jgi:hypothetical protein